jgi:hypothetical protein
MRELKFNDKFKRAAPRLTDDEYIRLKTLIKKDGKVHNPILTWNDVIIDGHNRYEIAFANDIPFTTKSISFESDEEAIIWIKENAISQRNMTDFAKIELVKEIEILLKEIGKKKKSESGRRFGRKHPKDMSQMTEP